MDGTYGMLMVALGGLIVFLAVVRWAFGPFLPLVPPSMDPMTSASWTLYSDREKPWVARAHRKLASLPPPPRGTGELPGWSWRASAGDPQMTVRIDERSPDGRHVRGYILGTSGTLTVACNARTGLSLVKGWVTLSPDGSPAMTLRAGDHLLLHPGFNGLWQNEGIAHLRFDITMT